ncbi:DNA alkylation repair protein [Methanothermococcus thermolithotrophicus]|uniref:DNA alkylation repair protein n=1 Tax=Methanothermococcus thermolithotrophicus TaxID=2186 RepID=UPI000380160E|nr:DNA alkylation repair protein [Methanothermococcus thermolithotrophicus]
MNLTDLKKEILELADEKNAEQYKRFFKTGKGEYGEKDKFLGVRVPNLRKIAKKYKNIDYDNILELLKSEFHEERLTALFILIHKFKKDRETVYNIYINNLKYVNNWDLVDTTAPHIVGAHLFDKDKSILYKLANSKILWERRVAILSTFYFIKKNEFKDTIEISKILLNDKEDLIHKAVGWMLREVGKRDINVLEDFLKMHYKNMPRTMLRYAIEKFPEEKRKKYLNGEI